MEKQETARTERIRRSQEYRRLFRLGRRYETPHFYIYSLLNELGHPRLGLTVSRKAGNAVERNYIKRVVREVYRRNRPSAPLDILVSAKRHAATVKYQEVETEFLRFLEQINYEKTPHCSHPHL